MYTEAVQWFATTHLLSQTSHTRWEEVTGQDVQWWVVWLVSRYSDSYASTSTGRCSSSSSGGPKKKSCRTQWHGCGRPKVTEKLIPVFTSVELSRLERACQGRSFAQRRDAAIMSVFRATGIRLSESAGIRYDPVDAERSDLDLWQREITVRGKNGKQRIVKISYLAAVLSTGTSGCERGMPRPGGRSCGSASITAGQ